MQESIFTKIIRGEVPSEKIFENDDVVAFLDIHPVMPGHTLVVPKKQIEFIWDLDDKDYAALMAAVKFVGQSLREKLPQQHIGVQVVGVDVPHAHVHLIPFDTVEEMKRPVDMAAEPDFELLKVMADKLRIDAN